MLSWFEVFNAASAGAMRQIEALKRGRQHRHGFAGDSWGTHIEGAGAELAVAKELGLYWEPVVREPSELEGDVGALHVRSSPRRDASLIVHPDDPDGRFYLVTGSLPALRVVGSIDGFAAKREEWWREDTGRPAFFVPQSALDAHGS